MATRKICVCVRVFVCVCQAVKAVMCPDKESECPDETTCCQLPDETWGCCPMVKVHSLGLHDIHDEPLTNEDNGSHWIMNVYSIPRPW